MSVCDTHIWMREVAGGWGAGPNPEPLLVLGEMLKARLTRKGWVGKMGLP